MIVYHSLRDMQKTRITNLHPIPIPPHPRSLRSSDVLGSLVHLNKYPLCAVKAPVVSIFIIFIMSSIHQGRCYCGAISWSTTGKVDFTSMCHCKDCQTVSGSAFGTTSLMIYDPKGVKFEGAEPKVFKAHSEQGNTTQR